MELNATHGRKRQLALFFCAAAFMAMAGTIFDTTFANYLKDTFHINEVQRGRLEFPREFPGFAVTLLVGLLMFLPEVRVAPVAAAGAALGFIGLAFWSPGYGVMMVWMVLFSTGQHLMMPMESAIGLGLADPGRRGKRLGQLGFTTTTAALVSCVVIWIVFHFHPKAYHTVFLIGAGFALVCGLIYLQMRPHIPHNAARPRAVFHRRYWLYYVLCALFGARKQMYLTFGPWVIITIFGKGPATIAALYFTARVIGMWFKPFVGRVVDRHGPRPILVAEAVLLIGVCLQYVLALHLWTGTPAVVALTLLGRPITWGTLAVALIYVSFVLDDLLFAAEMARSTYAARLAPSRDELAGTLAAGVSINHAISVIAPTFGGLLWMASKGPAPVFLVAAGVMAVSLTFALQVRAPAHTPTPAAAPDAL